MSTSASSSSNRPQPDNSQRIMIQKFIDAFLQQGYLAENFNEMRSLPENKNSFAVFCHEAEPRLDTIEKILASQNVDFAAVINTAEVIRSAADRVCGSRLVGACTELQQHCTENDIERSTEAYKNVSKEYYILRDCFHHILQGERIIGIGTH